MFSENDDGETNRVKSFRTPSVPDRYLADAESARKDILRDVGIPGTCTPHNMRFVGAVEMMALCQASARGEQKGPLNFFVYMPGCPWCRAAFPEYLGAAWIGACRENDGPFYAVSSQSMKEGEGYVAREKLNIKTFPALFRVSPGGVVDKLEDVKKRTVWGFMQFFKRRISSDDATENVSRASKRTAPRTEIRSSPSSASET